MVARPSPVVPVFGLVSRGRTLSAAAAAAAAAERAQPLCIIVIVEVCSQPRWLVSRPIPVVLIIRATATHSSTALGSQINLLG